MSLTLEGLDETLEAITATLQSRAAAVDRAAEFPVENLELLRSSGVLGLLVPAQFGGPGGGLPELVKVSQALGASCVSTALIWGMHIQQVDTLIRFGSAPLKERILPSVAEGKIYIASITTETGKGGYILTAEGAVEEEGDGFRLDRQAPIVTGGEYADAFLVTARASESEKENVVSLVYLDSAHVELDVSEAWWPMGMRGTRSVGLRLHGKFPADHIVGDPGEFRAIAVDSMIPVIHLVWSASWLGAARGCLADVVALARSRERPRGLDTRSDLALYRLGRIRVDLEMVSAYLASTLTDVDGQRMGDGKSDERSIQIHLNALKVVAAEKCFAAVDQMIQLCGLAFGYVEGNDFPLERTFRDLRSASLNYSNDRLLSAVGTFTLADRGVHMSGASAWERQS